MGDNSRTLIELRDVYDGWSVEHKSGGTLVNRWHVNDRRHKPTQDWIDSHGAEYLANWSKGDG